jgi:putative membrane protein insertion efficiency factor
MNPLTHALRALVKTYQWTLSPFIGWHCRYQPTCSNYALEALSKHGAIRGSWLTLRRLSRCHPWGGWGYDPVPARGETVSRACACARGAAGAAHHHNP